MGRGEGGGGLKSTYLGTNSQLFEHENLLLLQSCTKNVKKFKLQKFLCLRFTDRSKFELAVPGFAIRVTYVTQTTKMNKPFCC